MTPDASLWRLSARYDHVDDLTASDLAWEWLRRNDDYDHDFEALGSADADPQALTEKIRQQWGLRFPDRPPEGST
ncbi:transcriptional regulator domain-containing protein [Shinella sp.]|uniref:transcriptional regulator domain-containing protein n=1 Tax=Shinella sp. TaxID=1870904 RepID=UPI0039E678A5